MSPSTRAESFELSENRPQDRRVAFGSLIGTTIEWYDYFVYAQAAALIFGPKFFSAVPENMQLLVAFGTVGISFLFRPLGAAVAGHYGDRIGRKKMLVLTLLLMGGATAIIGILPTAATIGIWAPILLILMRIVQGFSAGGEWGGAALMAVEHAPADKRGRFGGFPQIGVPLGMLTAVAFLAIVSTLLGDEAFQAWGWRIPFISSIALIVVGMWIRLGVHESPVFQEISENEDEVKMPLAQLFRFNGKQVAQAAILFAGNGVAGYMLAGGFITAYTTGELGLDRDIILNIVTLAAACWLLTTAVSAYLSDAIGRVRVYQIGYVWQLVWVFPMFWMVATGSYLLITVGLALFTIAIGFTYGPQSALFAEMFPARVRYSGASMGNAIGSILGGAFSPMIGQALVQRTGGLTAVGVYIVIVTVIALLVSFTVKDRRGQRLDVGAMDIPGAKELEAALAAKRA